MRNPIIALILTSALAAATPAFAQANADEIAQLKQRVVQLEKQVQELSQVVEPLKAQQAADNRRKVLRVKFERRMAEDREKYSQEQLREAENLMGVADQHFGSAEASEALQTLLKNYPTSNRAGCAALYVAQTSEGDGRLQSLRECIEKYNNCFYGDGVQVGAYARFLLAEDYRNQGEERKAAALYSEIRSRYPDALDHRGNLLVDGMKAHQ
jgi:TolA-binding protein